MKRLLVTLASVALLCTGLAVVLTSSTAQARDASTTAPRVVRAAPCVPQAATPDTYTAWADSGAVVTTEDNVVPGANTATTQWIYVGETAPQVITPAVPEQWWNFSPNNAQGPFVGPPAFDIDNLAIDPGGIWQGPHDNGGPAGMGTFQVGQGNGDWFHREPARAAITDIDYLWQPQARGFVAGVAEVKCDSVGGVDEDDGEVGGVVTETQISHQFKCGQAIRIERTYENGRLTDTDRTVKATGERCSPAQERIPAAVWERENVEETGL